MKKTVIAMLLGISICSMATVGCGNASNNKSVTNKQTSTEEAKSKLDKDNATTINYDEKEYKEVYDLYHGNELKAKEKYINKTVKITGEVSKITTENKFINVHISTKDNSYGADLQFEDNKENHDKIINLKIKPDQSRETEGDVITVYGYFTRYDGVNIAITNCEFA